MFQLTGTSTGRGIGMGSIKAVGKNDGGEDGVVREASATSTSSASTDTTYTDTTYTDTTDTDTDTGWQSINVFYGERASLPGLKPNQQWFSQLTQDQIVIDLLGNNGYFIDLAANDAVDLSNTLALEQHHGWTGLCVEPNPNYWYGLSHRKCTVVGALMGGRKEQVEVEFRGVLGGIVELTPNYPADPQAPPVSRYTAPIRDVLERFQVPTTIDYFSLDVEGAEMLIMKEFPFDRYTIRVLTVERPGADLRSLLEQNGYVFLKDLAWWGETLWAHKSMGLTPEHPKIKKIQTLNP